MPVINKESAPIFDVGGAVITGLAAPSRGSEDVAAWRVSLRPDQPSPRHALTHQEVFIVLDGAVTAEFAGREETASAGDALIIGANEEFSLVARGRAAEAVCVLPVGGAAVVDGQRFTPPWAE
jgi:quercetin dioxygenase-like cupin family protein